jgi:hypothetical protein
MINSNFHSSEETTAHATTTVNALLLQHDRRGLDLDLYQPWNGPRLLKWWSLGLGIVVLGFV